MLEEDEDAHQINRFSARKATICSAALPSSSSLRVSPRGGGSESASTSVFDPGSPALPAVDAEVGERERLLRLRLRAHDPLQGRIPRLVDRVGDGDDCRQRRADDVVAELGLALAGERAALEGQLGDLRDHRPLQALGDRGPEHGAVGVRGLLPEEDEVGLLALERLREREARGDEVGSGGAVVRDEDGAVGAHRQRLAQRVERALGAHRDDDDLALAGRVLQPQRLLDRVRVEGVQGALAGAVEPLGARVDPLVRGRIGHLFHADGDLHRADSS